MGCSENKLVSVPVEVAGEAFYTKSVCVGEMVIG